jgi:predicted ribosomally synthesized peptide with SipW-like signal peptide
MRTMTRQVSRRTSAPRWWVRLRAMLAAAVVLGVTAPTSLALWSDQEQGSGSFSAMVVPAPTLTRACAYYPGVLGVGSQVRIYWALPAGYTLNDIQVRASTSGLGSVLAPLTGFSVSGNTQVQGDGTYRTDVPTNLLGGLLGLGTELEIALVLAPQGVGGWQSRPASVASNAGLIAGLGGNCRNLS